MSLDQDRTMPISHGILTLLIVQVLIACTSATILDNATLYQTSTGKPLQCHEIKTVDVRSSMECALYCMKDLYSCTGYVFDNEDVAGRRCDVCFIHDVTTPLVAVKTSPSSISMLSANDKQSGKMLFKLKSHSVHYRSQLIFSMIPTK